MIHRNNIHTHDYLRLIGVPEMLPLTSPFDPGYDPSGAKLASDGDSESVHGLLDGG